MEPIKFQPESDPISHSITAELIAIDGIGLTFRIRSDGEDIGEIDLEELPNQIAFISGVGPGEKINNGYLRPASQAVKACLREDLSHTNTVVFDINNELII